MSVSARILALRGELVRAQRVLLRVEDFLVAYEARLPLSPGVEEAMVIAQALSNYYTCAETIFVRISRFFENGLEQDRWHQALLEKMVLEIPGLRPRVLSDTTFGNIQELLKFRHFTRYYFELDYDWDKLRFLLKKFNKVRVLLNDELKRFEQYLADLNGTED